MIVRCERLLDRHGEPRVSDGAPVLRDGWLTVGRRYVVLEIEINPRASLAFRRIEFRIESDDGGTPGLFSSSCFEVVDRRLPSSWRVELFDEWLTVRPEGWSDAGFWESFFDGEPDAVARYEATKRELDPPGLDTSELGPALSDGSSAVEILLQERREGR